MTNAAAGVVSDDVSLWVDGATRGETGTCNVDGVEVALAQQKCVRHTCGDVASDDVPLRIDSRDRDKPRPRWVIVTNVPDASAQRSLVAAFVTLNASNDVNARDADSFSGHA